ncbi:MAG: hypothetical protein GF388_01420, partial [Candidatus Aegiribacteria sp.]|nr:hypothetical protein [Candidatus Aegiribacteria sp.]MBD3294038.1 hypothetical protein [Candidatus Fermentibacteria bacterium]
MNSDKNKPKGREDPFWNSVASFDLEEVFALPEWLENIRAENGEDASAITSRSPVSVREELEALKTRVGDCRGCRLSEQRNSIVFGDGNPGAGILLVGEGPGANEDQQGLPFVGRAG